MHNHNVVIIMIMMMIKSRPKQKKTMFRPRNGHNNFFFIISINKHAHKNVGHII